MARPREPLNVELPYHITARCVHREHFPLPLEKVWEIFENHLFLFHFGFGIKIHSFVLMPNHFHMIVRAPIGGLSEGMQYLMRNTSLDFVRYSGRINQNYGQRYHSSLINSYHYYLHAYKYVYQNPLKAHLCKGVENYPFSTLQLFLGKKKFIVPIESDALLFDSMGVNETLSWLNQLPSRDDHDLIRRGLKKKIFSLPIDRVSRKDHPLETRLL